MSEQIDTATELKCHRCGYDLRAHHQAEKCPECGASVAEATRLAAIPRRPAWRDSDPRWRRRMLAGVWILVLMPLIAALQASGLAADIPAPVFIYPATPMALDETLLCDRNIYPMVLFCVGIALLFSRERGRQPSRLDWTRRCGVLCSYVAALLTAVPLLFLIALVLIGISAVFVSMPLKYQPPVTRLFSAISSTYVLYGPQPGMISNAATVVISAITILLACKPLFDALRSVASRRWALILLTPLACFSLDQIAKGGLYGIGLSNFNAADVGTYRTFFRSDMLVRDVTTLLVLPRNPQNLLDFSFAELAKWCIVFAIAVLLSVAQIKAWPRDDKDRRNVSHNDDLPAARHDFALKAVLTKF